MAISSLQRSAITAFASWETQPVVSIFLPQDTTRPDTEPTQLKAAVQWAHDSLVRDHGMSAAAADDLLAPLDGVHEPVPRPGRGTAWFAAPGHHTRITLPERTDELVSTGSVPDALRLLPHLLTGPEYFVLTVSQNHAQLFSANRRTIAPYRVTDLPKSLEDALWYVKREPSLERHGSGAAHTSGSGQQFHKDDIGQYLHLVDRAVTAALADSHAPLVVMGVAYEASMYINGSHYRHVLPTPIAGNPDHLDLAEIHRRSWALMAEQPGPAQVAAERVRSLLGTGRSLTDAAAIAESAANGAIDQMVVSSALTTAAASRGTLDAERTLLCRAVIDAMSSGARLHVVQPEELPAGAAAAAVLRY